MDSHVLSLAHCSSEQSRLDRKIALDLFFGGFFLFFVFCFLRKGKKKSPYMSKITSRQKSLATTGLTNSQCERECCYYCNFYNNFFKCSQPSNQAECQDSVRVQKLYLRLCLLQLSIRKPGLTNRYSQILNHYVAVLKIRQLYIYRQRKSSKIY